MNLIHLSNQKRSTLVALSLFVSLLVVVAIAGCSSPAPADASPVAMTAIVEASPTAGVATTEPLTATTPITTEEAVSTSTSLPDVPLNLDGFVDISVEELHEILPAHEFTLVNVHIPYEGELPDTDLFIQYNQISDHLAELPAKDAPIVLYCRTGPMSTVAAKTLVGLGYTRVYELEGGFDTWAAAGYELLKK